MKKGLVLTLAGVLVAVAGFAGGYFLAGQTQSTTAGGRGGFAQLSEAERQKLQTMSDAERQQFFKDKGMDMPQGGPGGMPGAGGRAGGATASGQGGPGGGTQVLEGVVSTYADGKLALTLTGGGSANVYVDTSTVVAAVDGKSATIAKGATVVITAVPEAAGVTAAKTVIVK